MKSLSESTKCRNLIENKDFQWLVERLEARIEKNYKMLASDDEPAEFYRRQAKIKSDEFILRDVQVKASLKEKLEERLEQHDRTKQPVARGA